jgi:hypothetical protein
MGLLKITLLKRRMSMSSGDVASSLPTFQGASRGKRNHKVMRTMELIHIFWPDLEKTVSYTHLYVIFGKGTRANMWEKLHPTWNY